MKAAVAFVVVLIAAVAVAIVTGREEAVEGVDPSTRPFIYTDADRAMWTRFEAFQTKHNKVYALGVEQKTAKFATFKVCFLFGCFLFVCSDITR